MTDPAPHTAPTASTAPEARPDQRALGLKRPRLLIAGLGNHEAGEARHGKALRGTLHNMGYELIVALAEVLRPDVRPEDWARGRGSRSLDVVLPSPCGGLSARLVAPDHSDLNGSGHDLSLDYAPGSVRVLSVLDDMDLPPGQMRLKARGSDGGHRGLRNVTATYGDQPRLRVGIGRPAPGQTVTEHVHQPVSPEARAGLRALAAELLVPTRTGLGARLEDLLRQGWSAEAPTPGPVHTECPCGG